jgi:biofilm PGA synthesis N-glycosyltransferase PgaC
MEIVFFLIFLLYFMLVIALIVGWKKAVKNGYPPSGKIDNLISVVIPVRNEQAKVASLINDLERQTYSAFEVVFVDDHSDDETNAVVRALIKDDDRFRIIKCFGHGKKKALTEGIEQGKGEIVVTTDADCCVGPDWLSSINQYFQDKKLKMAFGGVRVAEDETLFSNLQAVEFSSLIGTGAATNALNFPSMCNGANLAIRREVVLEVDAYNDNLHIPSGDDEFLLRKVHEKYPDGIRFMAATEVIVSTHPLSDLDEFIQQRIRWAGKWRHHDTMGSKVLAVGILTFQIAFILILPFTIAGLVSPEIFVLLVLCKLLSESFFLSQITKFLKVNWNWGSFIMLQFLYPIYVVFIGTSAHFQPFTWKGRRMKSIQPKVGVIADND